MKRNILIGTLGLLAASLIAADSKPRAEVIAAAKKLNDQPNYSFRLTSGSNMKTFPPVEGKTEKGGFTHITMMFGNTNTQVLMQGENTVARVFTGGWESVSNFNRASQIIFTGIATKNKFGNHATEAEELVADTKELKIEAGVYCGELTEETARKMLNPLNETSVSDARASVKFWVEKGVLSKYEFRRSGKMKFEGKESYMQFTNTLEISGIGTSKVNVPEDAKKAVAVGP